MKKNEFCDYTLDPYPPAESMIRMVPADKLDWKPSPNFMSLGQLISRLSGGLGSDLQMPIAGNWPTPEEMGESMKLENLPSCTVEEALKRLEEDKAKLRGVISGLTQKDFTNRVVSVPWGWQGRMERMALSFHEHFTNHKMQLFLYLKLLGLPVNTQTLYFG